MKHIKGITITALRIAVGTHLFISGLVKLIDPNWTAKPFLDGSYKIFKWMASEPFLLEVINQLNVWSLLIFGFLLVAGIFRRLAALLALVLLCMYYAAYPPISILQSMGAFGPEFIVNPLLIEILALLVIISFSGKGNVDTRLNIFKKVDENEMLSEEIPENKIKLNYRRGMLTSLLPIVFLASIAIIIITTINNNGVDAISGATVSGINAAIPGYQKLKQLNLLKDEEALNNIKKMAYGNIGNLKVSRLIVDNSYLSNEFFGYQSIHLQQLAGNYFTKERIYFTLKSMEVHGINTIILSLQNMIDHKLLNYFDEWGSQLQWISEIKAYNMDKFEEYVRRNLKYGASAVVISREVCDDWVANGSADFIDQAIDIVRKYNVPIGIGALSNKTIEYIIEKKLTPDFFLKSFHNVPEENKGITYCDNTEYFLYLMDSTEIPWIAFRTTAGGHIDPFYGYKFGLENGASFICDEMFDFQVKYNIDVFHQAIK